jgi:streptogramin lyase
MSLDPADTSVCATVMVVWCLSAAVAFAQSSGTFELLGKYRGMGALVASAVAGERVYLSYLYIDNTIDVVAVDPRTGEFQVFPNPAPSESGARCMAVGPDGNVYLGTLPGAHFLKVDVKANKLIDLGRPSPTEQYIWDVNFGPDGKLYGATYPQAKLVSYDPKTGKQEDLGRMDPVEQYAHYVVGSDDGFIYTGIGTSKANIAAYQISTGEHREILPEEFQSVGQANVYRGQDGNIYGTAAGHRFRLKNWTATPIGDKEASPAVLRNRLHEGRTVEIQDRMLRLRDSKTGEVTERAFAYQGNDLPLFRIAFGPDGELYGSSVLPIHFVKLDRATRTLPELGGLGGGEVYSFLSHGKQLLMGAYSGLAPLMAFDPSRPFSQESGTRNPALENFKGSDSGWRPEAMINGPGNLVYLGAVAGYGRLGGPLTVWNTETGSVEQYHHLIPDESVVSLTVWKDRIVGGTTVGGGGGSHPTQKEATVFIWNPRTREMECAVRPVTGASAIDDLITAPNGLVYGVAHGTLFVFDPESRTIKDRKPLPFPGTVYNSVAIGPDGRIWGLTREGIFSIDTGTNEAVLVAKAPEKVTGGFALRDGWIYFICGASVYRYRIAPPRM